MIAFLDSNALLSIAGNLSSTKLTEVRSTIRAHGINLFTGEIVINECVNKFRERFTTATANYQKAAEDVERLIGQHFLFGETALAAETHIEEYAARLRFLFADNGSSILPFPTVDHMTVASWAMKGTKPYNRGSKDGYRDTLIWFTITDLLLGHPEESVIFVTANHTDFSASKDRKEQLHSDLVSHLVDLGINSSRLTITSSLDLLFDTLTGYLKSQIESELRPTGTISRSEVEPESLWDQISGILDYGLPSANFPTKELLGLQYQLIETLDIDEITPLAAKIISIEPLAIGVTQVVLEVATRGTVSFEMHADDAPQELGSLICDDQGICYGSAPFQLPLYLSLLLDSDKWITSAAASWESNDIFEVFKDH